MTYLILFVLGAVNTITFCDNNRRFCSTSDDKSMRVWEWDIPVDMKYIGRCRKVTKLCQLTQTNYIIYSGSEIR